MWTELVEESIALSYIFGEEKVSLSKIKLVETKIEYGLDLNISMRLYLNQFPSNPPAKWVLNKYNVVQLTFRLITSEIFFFKTIKNCSYTGTIDIVEKEDHKSLCFVDDLSNDVVFIINSKWIYLNSISAYQSE